VSVGGVWGLFLGTSFLGIVNDLTSAAKWMAKKVKSQLKVMSQ